MGDDALPSTYICTGNFLSLLLTQQRACPPNPPGMVASIQSYKLVTFSATPKEPHTLPKINGFFILSLDQTAIARFICDAKISE